MENFVQNGINKFAVVYHRYGRLFGNDQEVKRLENQNITHTHKSSVPPTRYACRSCSAVETHAAKLPALRYCADVYARGGLELCGY